LQALKRIHEHKATPVGWFVRDTLG
jgi:hypothetical protein